MEKKLDFVLAGAMKSGTSSLAQLLSQHPEVNFCSLKEPHFFVREKEWARGYDYYASLFDQENQGQRMRGEGSTSFTMLMRHGWKAALRLYEHNPEIKLIYLMRDPLDRLVSQYMHMYLSYYTSDSLSEAIANHNFLLEPGRYAMQLAPYRALVGKGCIHITTFEAFKNHPKRELEKVGEFLGIDAQQLAHQNLVHANSSINKPKMAFGLKRLFRKGLLDVLRRSIPEQLKDQLYFSTIGRFQRKFKKKPLLSREDEAKLAFYYEQDVLAMEAWMERELTEWVHFKSALKLAKEEVFAPDRASAALNETKLG